jgi:hypothetical protein
MRNALAGITLKKPREYDDGYSREATRKWLMQAPNDPWHKSQMPISIKQIGIVCHGDRKDINDRIITEKETKRSNSLCQRIAKMIPMLEQRSLIFFQYPKAHQHGHLWLTPPQRCQHINPISTEAEWSLFARCLRCQNNKFMPVHVHGKPHALCYHCLPPSQYKALGGTLTKKSLIRDAITAMGLI